MVEKLKKKCDLCCDCPLLSSSNPIQIQSSNRILLILTKPLITNGTNSKDSVGQAGLPTSPTSCHRNQCSRTSIPLDLIFFLDSIFQHPVSRQKKQTCAPISPPSLFSQSPLFSAHTILSLCFLLSHLSFSIPLPGSSMQGRSSLPTSVCGRERHCSLQACRRSNSVRASCKTGGEIRVRSHCQAGHAISPAAQLM